MIFNNFLRNLSKCKQCTTLFYSTKLVDLSNLRKMAIPKTRENPIVTKLETPEFKSIFTEELTTLASLFKKYEYELRIAGGAVRDMLVGIQPKDLDFATTATPAQMKDMFNAENVRMINTNGEKHGTITPRINDKAHFEVTTLRIDVVTDGRRAEVQFTTDWMLDAFRRDLTINSMFCSLDGSVYDYFYGYEDLKQRRIAFVGDPVSRIREDYLRILRYFRFYGRIALEPSNHEENTIKAIKDNVEGLGKISGERIWMELSKILEGNFAGDLMIKIIECGLSQYIGLPANPNLQELKRVWKECGHLNLMPMTLLSSLLHTQDDSIALNARLKLSSFERDLSLFIVQHRAPKPHKKPLMPYKQLVVKSKSKPSDTKKMAIEVLKYNNSPYIQEFELWEIPKFPITGNMLKEKGVESGRFMGVVMNELKHYWADNDFCLSAEKLLEEVPRVLEVLNEKKKRK